MNASKRVRLEEAGWRIGSAYDFLGMSADEAAYVEIKLSLARKLRRLRRGLRLTQEAVADAVGSSQSRVAKMEAGDPSVSIDILCRTLLALGLSRQALGRAMVSGSSGQAS